MIPSSVQSTQTIIKNKYSFCEKQLPPICFDNVIFLLSIYLHIFIPACHPSLSSLKSLGLDMSWEPKTYRTYRFDSILCRDIIIFYNFVEQMHTLNNNDLLLQYVTVRHVVHVAWCSKRHFIMSSDETYSRCEFVNWQHLLPQNCVKMLILD